MFASLRSRLFVTYLAIAGLVLAMIALTLLAFLSRNQNTREGTYSNLETTARLVAGDDVWLGPQRARVNVYLRRLDQSMNSRFVLLNRDGSVIGDSRSTNAAIPEETWAPAAAVDELTRGEVTTQRGTTWLYVAVPLDNELVLVVAALGPTLRASLIIWGTDFLRPLLRAGALALMFSALFAWWMSRSVAAPLKEMADATEAIAAGEFAELDPDLGPREIQALTMAFNHMAAELHASQTSQRDFVANVSHDLKTPLTSIQGFAQALMDGTVSEAEGRVAAARVIYDESDRLRRLVDDLLDLARIDAGQVEFKREPVDLGPLLEAVMAGASLRAQHAGVILEHEQPDRATIIGDGDRLSQVFTNLVDNAIKHSPQGGQVRVWTKREQGWVSIHVDDQGEGIPEEELSRIFERFYQVDKSRTSGRGRGVGLGLAIVSELVEAHGGRVVAQSSSEVGSRFTVQLPIARPSDVTIASRKMGAI